MSTSATGNIETWDFELINPSTLTGISSQNTPFIFIGDLVDIDPNPVFQGATNFSSPGTWSAAQVIAGGTTAPEPPTFLLLLGGLLGLLGLRQRHVSRT